MRRSWLRKNDGCDPQRGPIDSVPLLDSAEEAGNLVEVFRPFRGLLLAGTGEHTRDSLRNSERIDPCLSCGKDRQSRRKDWPLSNFLTQGSLFSWSGCREVQFAPNRVKPLGIGFLSISVFCLQSNLDDRYGDLPAVAAQRNPAFLRFVERYSHKEKRDGSKFVFCFCFRRSGRFDRDDLCSMLRHRDQLRQRQPSWRTLFQRPRRNPTR